MLMETVLGLINCRFLVEWLKANLYKNLFINIKVWSNYGRENLNLVFSMMMINIKVGVLLRFKRKKNSMYGVIIYEAAGRFVCNLFGFVSIVSKIRMTW